MAVTTLDTAEQQYRLLHASALMALFCVGLYAAAFGPALPFFAEDLDVPLDTAGLLLTGFFLGSITSSSLVAIALHGKAARSLTIAGLVSALTGLLLLATAPTWPVALAGAGIMGIGDGLMVSALHILMATTSSDVPSAINRLNLYFAFGAVAGPLWAGAVLASTGERSIVFGGIAACVVVTLAVMLAAPGGPEHEVEATADEGFRLPGHPTAWIMGLVLFLYVGAEFGLGAWVSAFARESAGAGVFQAAVLTAGYWFALMCGRLFSGAYFGRRREPTTLLAASIAGAGLSSLLLAAVTGNLLISGIAAFGAGLCLGPVWPATVAIAAEGSPAHATAATVTMGNAGGVAIPWLQGRVLVGSGPAQGVAVTSVLCAVMLMIVMGFRARRNSEGALPR